jgi:peptide/nickel transport system ATP-binding protein
MADTKAKSGLLLDIRNLRIEATVYPPGEAPRTITLVHDVSLTLEQGKVLGLIGESGAGKSTIGLSSMGYGRGGVRITGGEVILNGRDILKGGKEGFRKLRGREVCYVAQSAAAAFNPAHRLMDQVVRRRSQHGTALSRQQAEPRSAPWRCSGSSACRSQHHRKRFPTQVSRRRISCSGDDSDGALLESRPDRLRRTDHALDVTRESIVLAAIKDAIRDTEWRRSHPPRSRRCGRRSPTRSWCCAQTAGSSNGAARARSIKEPRREYRNALVSVHPHRAQEEERRPAGRRPILSGRRRRHRRLVGGWQAIKVLEERFRRYPLRPDAGGGRRVRLQRTDAGARHHTGLLRTPEASARSPSPATTLHRSRLADCATRIGASAADDLPDGRRRDESRRARRSDDHQAAIGVLFRHAATGSATPGSAELLDKIEMGKGFQRSLPGRLSGGQTSSASASPGRCAAKPSLIICDGSRKPALDPLRSARQHPRCCSACREDEGVAYLFITHDLAHGEVDRRVHPVHVAAK